MDFGWFCAEPGVGLDDPCRSLPTQVTLSFYDMVPLINAAAKYFFECISGSNRRCKIQVWFASVRHVDGNQLSAIIFYECAASESLLKYKVKLSDCHFLSGYC